jgi:hypothetical protein
MLRRQAKEKKGSLVMEEEDPYENEPRRHRKEEPAALRRSV